MEDAHTPYTIMEIINKNLLDEVSSQAKASPRLRINYNFHQSLDDLCHRMLNALELRQEAYRVGKIQDRNAARSLWLCQLRHGCRYLH